MATRLDRQRQPGRYHIRKNSRWYRRGYSSLPHPVWGDTGEIRPIIEVLSPSTSVVNVEVTVQIVGRNFKPYSTVEIDDVDAPTVYVNPTRLTFTATPTVVGTKVVHVNNDDPNIPGHEASNDVTYTVTATSEDPENDPHVTHPGSYTIAQIQEWIDQHPIAALILLLRSHEAAYATPRVTLLDWIDGFLESLDGIDP